MVMSGGSKRRSKRIDRSFDAKILRAAKELAARYQVVLQWEDEEFYGRGFELPLVMAGGKTADECVANTREALTGVVAYMLETGKSPPAPASDAARSVQVNIRVTLTEKAALEQAAQRGGFRGISDYMRHAALAGETM
jgi:predicted RNase H-like HicB family nuclease